MALMHEFLLVSKKDHNSFNISAIIRNDSGKIIIKESNLIDVVEIDDELISYLFDFFNWIPTSYHKKSDKSFGLNYYGMTYIPNNSNLYLKKIFGALEDLFSIAPETFELKGSFCWKGDSEDLGTYEYNTFIKQEVMGVLKKMISWSEYMITDHNLYIVHMGI